MCNCKTAGVWITFSFYAKARFLIWWFFLVKSVCSKIVAVGLKERSCWAFFVSWVVLIAIDYGASVQIRPSRDFGLLVQLSQERFEKKVNALLVYVLLQIWLFFWIGARIFQKSHRKVLLKLQRSIKISNLDKNLGKSYKELKNSIHACVFQVKQSIKGVRPVNIFVWAYYVYFHPKNVNIYVTASVCMCKLSGDTSKLSDSGTWNFNIEKCVTNEYVTLATDEILDLTR